MRLQSGDAVGRKQLLEPCQKLSRTCSPQKRDRLQRAAKIQAFARKSSVESFRFREAARRRLESRRLKQGGKKTGGCNFEALTGNRAVNVGSADGNNSRRSSGSYGRDKTV